MIRELEPPTEEELAEWDRLVHYRQLVPGGTPAERLIAEVRRLRSILGRERVAEAQASRRLLERE